MPLPIKNKPTSSPATRVKSLMKNILLNQETTMLQEIYLRQVALFHELNGIIYGLGFGGRRYFQRLPLSKPGKEKILKQLKSLGK